MITVLIPSRGRPKRLKDSVRSLQDNADSALDIRIAFDDDDKTINEFKVDPNTNIKIFPRYGYKNLHLYVNSLCQMEPTPNWFLLFNDDAIMCTKSWDSVIKSFDHTKPCVLNLNGAGMNLFPVVSQTFYNTLGYFSQSPHNDSYVSDIANEAGCFIRVYGIQINHLRDEINDATKTESQDCYKITSPEYYGDKIQNLIKLDIEKIKKGLQ